MYAYVDIHVFGSQKYTFDRIERSMRDESSEVYELTDLCRPYPSKVW